MQFWERLKKRDSEQQFAFHFVCCEKLDKELKRIKERYFGDFNRKKKARVVNGLIRLLEPYLRHHLNLKRSMWDLDLKAGEAPLSNSTSKRSYMTHELWVLLDLRSYRVIKKLHEGVNSLRGGTFSMALVLRAALIKCFELLDKLGRDGLVSWVKMWLKEHKKKYETAFREEWSFSKPHMGSIQSKKVKYIAFYTENYRQLHLYHPPPPSKRQ